MHANMLQFDDVSMHAETSGAYNKQQYAKVWTISGLVKRLAKICNNQPFTQIIQSPLVLIVKKEKERERRRKREKEQKQSKHSNQATMA